MAVMQYTQDEAKQDEAIAIINRSQRSFIVARDRVQEIIVWDF